MPGSLYIHRNFYLALMGICLLFVFGIALAWAFTLGMIGLGFLLICSGYDLYQLWRGPKHMVQARRIVADHLSNGDYNPVRIILSHQYPFLCHIEMLDELPVQFQARDQSWHVKVRAGEKQEIAYQVRPVERGLYAFGSVNLYVDGPLQLMRRRFVFVNDQVVKVYPSYLQLRKFAFLAFDRRLQMPGRKRMRRIGHTTEFEQIKEYVIGDDSRTINWKATARAGRAMVNQYRDERAQPVYCLIDKGRLMQMPFDGMTLLDYAINTALVMSHIAIRKEDHAGLLAFADHVDTFVVASRRNNQMYRISEALYAQETGFPEADFERLYLGVNRMIRQRSLLLLFTNFESIQGLRRQLPYLRKLAETHVLVVIFFQNTELAQLISEKADTLRQVYHQTIAQRMQQSKEQMGILLRQHGIHTILTIPRDLTVDTINQYLELKARGLA